MTIFSMEITIFAATMTINAAKMSIFAMKITIFAAMMVIDAAMITIFAARMVNIVPMMTIVAKLLPWTAFSKDIDVASQPRANALHAGLGPTLPRISRLNGYAPCVLRSPDRAVQRWCSGNR